MAAFVGRNMTRLIGITLVIWGLIAQPLVASMSAPVMESRSHASMAADSHPMSDAMGHHGVNSSGDMANTLSQENSVEHCDNCNTDCANEICTSSCGIGGAAAIQKTSINPRFLLSALLVDSSRARISGLPARIFHPPKHA